MGYRATLVGTPGDDRIRATFKDDVIITLGGNDVIVGPKGGEWGTTSALAPATTKSSTGREDFLGLSSHIDLGPGDDRMTVTSRPLQIAIIRAGPGDDTIIFGRRSWADVVPGPGDDLIRGPDLRVTTRRRVSICGGRQVRSASTLLVDTQRARGTTGSPRTLDARRWPVQRRAARHPEERPSRRRRRAGSDSCRSR